MNGDSLSSDSIDIGRATIRQRARDLLEAQEKRQAQIAEEDAQREAEARRENMLARAANVFRQGDEDLDGADPILVSIYNTFGQLRDVENYHEFDVEEDGPVDTALVEDLRLAYQNGTIYVLGPACSKCGGEFYQRVHVLEDVARAFEHPERSYHHNCPESRRETGRPGFAKPTFPLGFDEEAGEPYMKAAGVEYLRAIAHNLAVIAQQLDYFFDCGASGAGRGV